MTPRHFVDLLSDVQLPDVFNPYADRCKLHDLKDAPMRRRRNLQAYLEHAIACGASTVWVARDLGYRGGRRTGIAMTDEIHLERATQLLGGVHLQRATKGPAVAERTAAVVWRILSALNLPVVLWNVFPFHPHDADDPFSNRCHTRSEREATMPLFAALIELIQPRNIVAIGREAAAALADIGSPVSSVRHPSYGGQKEFIAGLQTIYGVEARPEAMQFTMLSNPAD
jgi:uracil-DNA glycosylase